MCVLKAGHDSADNLRALCRLNDYVLAGASDNARHRVVLEVVFLARLHTTRLLVVASAMFVVFVVLVDGVCV